MGKKIGRIVKSGVITLHSIGAIFKYMKSNIKNSKNEIESNGDIKIDKFNTGLVINSVQNATKVIIKPGTDKAFKELKKIYVHSGERIIKIDKVIFNIHSKEEFNGIKDNLKDQYERILNELNENINSIQSKIEDTWVEATDNIDSVKKDCIEYIDRVFNINKNSKNFRSMDKEEFLSKFNFDASAIFDIYKTIPYKNLNEIPIFKKILNNIKINIE